jgi:hypothetical protein
VDLTAWDNLLVLAIVVAAVVGFYVWSTVPRPVEDDGYEEPVQPVRKRKRKRRTRDAPE